MPRSIGFAYSIAGAAVAALVIVVAGTTVGLPGSAGAAEGGQTQAEVQIPATQDAPVSLPWPGVDAASPIAPSDGQELLPAAGEQVEYVYVDEPSRGYEDDDHDDDDDEDEDDDHEDDDHERRERRDRDDHDEDDE